MSDEEKGHYVHLGYHKWMLMDEVRMEALQAMVDALVQPGDVVVDVGTSRVTDGSGKTRTVGDVEFEGVREVAGWVSPVPGGVGPMTVATLLSNVVEAAERRAGFA